MLWDALRLFHEDITGHLSFVTFELHKIENTTNKMIKCRYFHSDPPFTLCSPFRCLYTDPQIDDDENVAETILVEIHADNEESFIDKNVTLTVFKIGESPGTD